MVQRVEHSEVLQLKEDGAQVVEVLPKAEFEELHIEGAISLPLTQLNRESASKLDPERPVIVYCWDHQ